MKNKNLTFIYITISLIILLLSLSFVRIYFVETKNPIDIKPKIGKYSGDIYYEEYGDSTDPTILLTHGTGAWAGTWFSNIPTITKAGFHVIAIDLPPFGFSNYPTNKNYSRDNQAKIINSFVKSLNLKNITLVGHSYGGGPALEASMLQPELYNHLILIDAAIGLNSPPLLPNSFIYKLLENKYTSTFFVSLIATQPFFSSYLLKSFVYNKESVDDSRTYVYQKPFAKKQFSENLALWSFYFSTENDSLLSKNISKYKNFNLKTTIIWGKEDNITPINQAEELNKLIPNSKLIILDNVGHIPQIENIDLFNESFINNLKGNSSN